MDEPIKNTEQDIESWLRVFHAPRLKPRFLHRLLTHFGHPARLLDAGPRALEALLGPAATSVHRSLHAGSGSGPATDLAWMQSSINHHILSLNDPRYPALLKEIADPPLVLYVRGSPEPLNRPQISIVGSRNPSATGQETASLFAVDLSRSGYTITSGMALGIDAAAHVGALRSGGTTIAVAATGLDRVYPARHDRLASDISNGGAIISEFPVGTPPRRTHFPRRNRLISGLSLGTLVVEATPRSGSLITARFAAEQGREVFAIPGSIYSPLARGCHALIRDGAALAECPDDVLEELGCRSPGSTSRPAMARSSTVVAPHPLLVHLGHDPATIDDLVRRSGLTAGTVCSMLLQLELEGLVVSSPGGSFVRNRLI